MKAEIKNIEKLTEGVDGRITAEEAELLYLLARDAEGEGQIVEIGSYHGYSTIWLASGSRVRNRERVFAVDPQNTSAHGSSEAAFRKNINNAGLDDYIVPVISTSAEAALNWQGPVRLLWIDGAHDYENAKNDFMSWEKYLVNGGIVAFHDYLSMFHPGLTKAVKETIIDSDNYTVLGCVNTVVFAKKVDRLTPLDKLGKESFMKLLLPREQLEADFRKAQELVEGGMFQEADKLLWKCKEGLQTFFSRKYALIRSLPIANLYRKMGILKTAENIYREILSYNEAPLLERYYALCGLGTIYTSENKHIEAENMFKDALSIENVPSGNRVHAVLGLGRCLSARGKDNDAERHYKESLGIGNLPVIERCRLLNRLGNIYFNNGMHTEAEQIYMEVLGIDDVPADERTEAVMQAGKIYSKNGRDGEAEKLYKETLSSGRIGNLQRYRLLNRLGDIYSRLGKYDLAGSRFQEALSIEAIPEEDRYHALLGRGKCYRIKGEHGKAEEKFKEAFSYAGISDEIKLKIANELLECCFNQRKFQIVEEICGKILTLNGITDQQKRGLIAKVREKIISLKTQDGGTNV